MVIARQKFHDGILPGGPVQHVSGVDLDGDDAQREIELAIQFSYAEVY